LPPSLPIPSLWDGSVQIQDRSPVSLSQSSLEMPSQPPQRCALLISQMSLNPIKLTIKIHCDATIMYEPQFPAQCSDLGAPGILAVPPSPEDRHSLHLSSSEPLRLIPLTSLPQLSR
jgi:hypothetical protein